MSVTLGTRGERTTFSGFELQPAVRAKYTPRADAFVWGAISRAVRTPTRFDQDLRVRVGNVVVIRGDSEFKPEQLTAYESGARFNPALERVDGGLGLLQRVRRLAQPGSDAADYAGEPV